MIKEESVAIGSFLAFLVRAISDMLLSSTRKASLSWSPFFPWCVDADCDMVMESCKFTISGKEGLRTNVVRNANRQIQGSERSSSYS